MSVLINNDLIWVSIPRCASHSIEYALMNSTELNCKHITEYNDASKIYDKPYHFHYTLKSLYNNFGIKDSVCITRHWLDRWLNSLEHMYRGFRKYNLIPFVEWKDINNEYIYEIFNKEFVNDLYNEESIKCLSKILNEDIETIRNYPFYDSIIILSSDKIFKEGGKCTYEFDIKEMGKFEDFIQKRYNVNFKLPVINKHDKVKNGIIINDELIKWIWDKFEAPFIKSNKLI